MMMMMMMIQQQHQPQSLSSPQCRRLSHRLLSKLVLPLTLLLLLFTAMIVDMTVIHSSITTVQAFKTTTTATTMTTTSQQRPFLTVTNHHHKTFGSPTSVAVVMPQQRRHAATVTAMNVATGGGTGTSGSGSSTSSFLSVVEWNEDRMKRSVVASLGCVSTWCMARFIPSYTIVQACCATGLLSCLLFTTPYFNMKMPAYSVAAFCGALAGMSGNVLLNTATAATGTAVSQMALPLTYFAICVGYAFGVWDYQKWGVGKGGRLGTIAFGGNLFYSVTSMLYHKFILKHTTTTKAVTLLSATTKSLFSSLPILTSLALSTWLLQTSRKATVDENTATTKSSSTDTQQQYIAKILLYCTIAIPMFMNGKILSAREYISTTASIFIGCQCVHRTIGKYGPILPTSVVGMLGSLIFAKSFHGITSPKIFLGALMGLTTIPSFGVFNFVQSSLLSALLFHLGPLDGFGGRLGCLAYIGVLFGM